jgi:hypothetical protein
MLSPAACLSVVMVFVFLSIFLTGSSFPGGFLILLNILDFEPFSSL